MAKRSARVKRAIRQDFEADADVKVRPLFPEARWTRLAKRAIKAMCAM